MSSLPTWISSCAPAPNLAERVLPVDQLSAPGLVETLFYLCAQGLQLDLAELVPLGQEPEGLADDLARRRIATALDFLLDQLLEIRSERDVHERSVTLMTEIVKF